MRPMLFKRLPADRRWYILILSKHTPVKRLTESSPLNLPSLKRQFQKST
jgi:hypothetical protein